MTETPHSIQIVVRDDLRRSRLTVLFRFCSCFRTSCALFARAFVVDRQLVRDGYQWEDSPEQICTIGSRRTCDITCSCSAYLYLRR